ncbi:MAG: hypothetical protein EA400_05730 [Chromatiaceae bacterium]|nr:MAG: hypothetical protein EA400_05730 [Chromatiaceae bacterium]
MLLDDQHCFITAAIHNRRRLLDTELKERLITLSHAACAAAPWRLEQWVMLDKHCHLVAKSPRGSALVAALMHLSPVRTLCAHTLTGPSPTSGV